MIEGKSMRAVQAEESEISDYEALCYEEAIKQLGRLDARGIQLRRPDRVVEIPSRHQILNPVASDAYTSGYTEERDRMRRER
jgi:hypothetical protein